MVNIGDFDVIDQVGCSRPVLHPYRILFFESTSMRLSFNPCGRQFYDFVDFHSIFTRSYSGDYLVGKFIMFLSYIKSVICICFSLICVVSFV